VDRNGNVLPGLSIGSYNAVTSDPQGLGLDSTIRDMISRTPLPNNFTAGDGLNTAGFTFVAPQTEKQFDVVAKIDHVLNDRNNVFARVAFGHQDTLCDQVNGGEPRFPGLPCTVNTERRPWNVALNWRWNPTSTIVNELVLGGNHFTFNFNIPAADPRRPTIDGGSFTQVTAPDEFEFGNMRTINTYQLVDNLGYVRGSHSFKLGTNIRFQQHKDVRGSVAGLNINPLIDFSTTINTVDPGLFGIPGDLNTTFDRPALQQYINFLLGRVGRISQGFVARGDEYGPGGTRFVFDARYPELDFYAQDNWKPGKNLTVDLGLRWELKLAPRNPDDLIRRPDQRVAVGEPPSNTLRWNQGKLYGDDLKNLAPSAGIAWDPTGSAKTSLRANYRLAYDRINTFVLSSRIYQSIPGLTAGVVNTDFGQAGGRLRNLPAVPPPATKPSNLLQPPPTSSNSITVVDPKFQAPRTHEWTLSFERELWKGTVFQAAYVGHKADRLFGAYNVNQARYRDNGFLDAFNTVKAGGESDLINRLLLPDSRRLAGETGSQLVRRLFASTLNLNAVASLAAAIGTRIQGGKSIPELAGFGPYFFFPYPQYLGGLFVIDSNDYSRYSGLELKLERRFHNGLGFLVAYTLSRSKDTRSFDPAFTVVSTGAAQSAGGTPYDIFNRSLNYARSDFDRLHVGLATVVAELPFGKGKRFGGDASGALDRIIGGWELTGFMVWESGRPFTIYSGANTFSNVVQTPANCNGCTGKEGALFDDPVGGVKYYLTPEERAKFNTPGAGEFTNTGRNFLIGPPSFRVDLGLLKRFRIGKDNILEYRVEATNLTNHPTFGFPTATITSGTFGRIRDNVISSSRKVQLGLKYSF
jgi:hypothetical protein